MPNERLGSVKEEYKKLHDALMTNGGYRLSMFLGIWAMVGGSVKSDSMVIYGSLAVIATAGIAEITEKLIEVSKKD